MLNDNGSGKCSASIKSTKVESENNVQSASMKTNSEHKIKVAKIIWKCILNKHSKPVSKWSYDDSDENSGTKKLANGNTPNQESWNLACDKQVREGLSKKERL